MIREAILSISQIFLIPFMRSGGGTVQGHWLESTMIPKWIFELIELSKREEWHSLGFQKGIDEGKSRLENHSHTFLEFLRNKIFMPPAKRKFFCSLPPAHWNR